eukprot:CAMPEP_0175122100 /NCGR_PEP_ID=MMETSP0087-20121206/1535_1 /TAXON_ID=136419 /ORGANISM="Unknown Unknown, Strain D1" /LENGTH=207 /DNA_ID=CAMNT_0016403713 /DNA_START=30 /DNA_END=653 /DNA_ORIENTATION=+
MATKQATNSNITLQGSAAMVAEYFNYCINSILYTRGVYDPDTFSAVKKYGLRMQITNDEGLKGYIQTVMSQLQAWLQTGQIKKLVVVITSIDTEEVMERWGFNVETDEKTLEGKTKSQEKSEKEIQKEIAAVLRQLTQAVSFLPLLDCPCTFDLLVYTAADLAVPQQWEESDPRYIAKSNQVRFRSFSTKIHKVETSVAYKAEADED